MVTSKNYLTPIEIRELNRLTTILLDIFEDQMDLGRLTLMTQAAKLLDDQIKGLGRVVLRTGGSVAMADAKKHAEREYEKYKANQKALRHEQADQIIADIKATQKSLGRGRKD
jgi:hypothetical protein